MAEDIRTFLFVLTSGRKNGNAELLARHAAKALPARHRQIWLDAGAMQLPLFEDRRHSGGQHPWPEGDLKTLFEATLAATDLVFVAPVYWYSIPAPAKLYLDHWTDWLRLEGVNFKARMAETRFWAVSMLSDHDLPKAGPTIDTLKLCADYVGASWGGSVIGVGNRPGDVLKEPAALRDAERLFAEGGDFTSAFADR